MHVLEIKPGYEVAIRYGGHAGRFPGYHTRMNHGLMKIDASENAYPISVSLRGSLVAFDPVMGTRKLDLEETRDTPDEHPIDFVIRNPGEFAYGDSAPCEPMRSGQPRVMVEWNVPGLAEAMIPYNRYFCEECSKELPGEGRWCKKHAPPPSDRCGRPIPDAPEPMVCTKKKARGMIYCAACMEAETPSPRRRARKKRKAR